MGYTGNLPAGVYVGYLPSKKQKKVCLCCIHCQLWADWPKASASEPVVHDCAGVSQRRTDEEQAAWKKAKKAAAKAAAKAAPEKAAPEKAAAGEIVDLIGVDLISRPDVDPDEDRLRCSVAGCGFVLVEWTYTGCKKCKTCAACGCVNRCQCGVCTKDWNHDQRHNEWSKTAEALQFFDFSKGERILERMTNLTMKEDESHETTDDWERDYFERPPIDGDVPTNCEKRSFTLGFKPEKLVLYEECVDHFTFFGCPESENYCEGSCVTDGGWCRGWKRPSCFQDEELVASRKRPDIDIKK